MSAGNITASTHSHGCVTRGFCTTVSKERNVQGHQQDVVNPGQRLVRKYIFEDLPRLYNVLLQF